MELEAVKLNKGKGRKSTRPVFRNNIVKIAAMMGGNQKLAEKLNMHHSLIGKWIYYQEIRVLPKHAIKMEKLCKGLFKRWDLCTDYEPFQIQKKEFNKKKRLERARKKRLLDKAKV